MQLSRRRFLKVSLSSMACFTIEATAPNWILRSAQALGTGNGFPDGRILVLVQLAGGNDGLNTVIPRTDPLYYASRPRLAIPAGKEINLDTQNGLHPRLWRLANWYQRGNLAIVHNVGYANPNLSHFSSMDHWDFATTPGEAPGHQGWVAKFFDNACGGAPDIDALKMVGAGQSALAPSMSGSAVQSPPTIKAAANYVLTASTDREIRLATIHDLNNLAPLNTEVDFIRRTANMAEASVTDVAKAAALPVLVNEYSTDSLGNGLKLVSQIIRAGFRTSIFYVSQSGYDTHSDQVDGAGDIDSGNHPSLLNKLDLSLNAFLTEMKMTGNLDRVILMTFSEFGRRVQENSSYGTDHGAGNCLFVAGGHVSGGVYGGQPNLSDLIKGNLKHKIDFRSVYATVMQDWMRQPAAPVFGQQNYEAIIAPELPKLRYLKNTAAAESWREYA